MHNFKVLNYSQTKAEIEFYRKKMIWDCRQHKSSAVMQTIKKHHPKETENEFLSCVKVDGAFFNKRHT